MYEMLDYSWRDHMAAVTLDRLGKLNAISPRMAHELRAVADTVRAD